MNAIFRLILQIFQAVFEEDLKNREQKRRGRQNPATSQPKSRQPSQHQQAPRRMPPPPTPKDPPHSNVGDPLSAWLEEVMGVPAQKPKPQPRTPRPVVHQEPLQETLAEHLAHTEARSHHLEEHLRDYLGVTDKKKIVTEPKIQQIMGPKPLRQLVLADIILGAPVCKRRGGLNR